MVKSKMETQDVCEKYAKPWRFEMMRIIMIVGLLALISFTSVSAIIINVPGDSATIQGGINGASDGDTVLIYPGTYFENVNFNGTNLILGSLFLIAGDTSYISSTIIDGSSSGSVITLETNEFNTAKITGLTITNGSAFRGGGIHCYHTAVTISHNIIRNNSASEGGGIHCEASFEVIEDNIILNNTASSVGAGIRATYGNPEIKYNLIINNFSGNWGGGIYVNNNNPLIKNNTITGNIAAGLGGGIRTGNASPLIINCIVYDNDASGGPEISVDGSPVVTYCDVMGGFTGAGNIDADPLFIGEDVLDYHLRGASLCIDAGNPADPLDPDSTRADMGAIYFDQRYRILDFHLIEPSDSTLTLNTAQTFKWHSTEDVDSGYIVVYNLIWDDDPLFGSPDSTGLQSDTVYTLSGELDRSIGYFWRVIADNGHAVPHFSNETWGFYIDGYPTAPGPISPFNGAIVDSNTAIIWYASVDPDSFDAASYTIQIDDDSLFESPEINQSGLSNTMLDEAFVIQLGQLDEAENLQPNMLYYWRVRSDDNYGLSSPWQDSLLYFTYLGQNHPPNPPASGFSPTNYEEVISLTPTVTWNNATDPDPDDNPGTLHYIFWLFSDTSTGCGFEYWDTTDVGINQVTVADSMPDNCLWIYFVKTVDDEGLESGWSAMQHFWTNHYNYPPEPFPLYSPDSDHTTVVLNTMFEWGNTVDYDPMSSFTFTLEYSPDSLFNDNVSSVEGLSDTAFTISTDTLMLVGDDLYWRVLAVDDDSLARIGGIPEEFRNLRVLPPGDANCDGSTNGLDVIYLVNYFKGGSAPCIILAGDANGSCGTNGLDVTYLVNFFKGGSAPIRPDCEQRILIEHEKQKSVNKSVGAR